MIETAISVTEKKDGERRMVIVRRKDGLFRFVEEMLYRGEFINEPTWGPKRDRSGLYETANEAISAAKAECPWFADEVD
jgi:hypothetical protein